MCPAIDIPASCKICVVIHCLHAENLSAAEVDRDLRVVCCQNVMSERTVRQWCKIFKDVANEEE
jgi:hypothetical protein